MRLELFFFLFSWIIVASTAADNRTESETKIGCQPKCGNVNIPYPFGIGRNCSIASWANVNCNASFNPPRPFFGEIEIAEISQTEIRIKNYIATTCFNQSGGTTLELPAGFTLEGSPYTFSSTKNKLTAIGCDTFVLARMNNNTYSSGCSSLCNKLEDVIEGSCSGIGCCQSSIPKGLKVFYVTAGSIYDHTRIWSFNKCGSTFLVEEEKYKFKVSDFTNTTSILDIPIVVNFALGNQTCRAAKLNTTTFACKDNSFCYDSVDGTGYLCSCNTGYKGNPYLDNGCQGMIF